MFGVSFPEAPLAERTTLRYELLIRGSPPAGPEHAYATLPIKSNDAMIAIPAVEIPRNFISNQSFFAITAAIVLLSDAR
jgi:hypothetical protein